MDYSFLFSFRRANVTNFVSDQYPTLLLNHQRQIVNNALSSSLSLFHFDKPFFYQFCSIRRGFSYEGTENSVHSSELRGVHFREVFINGGFTVSVILGYMAFRVNLDMWVENCLCTLFCRESLPLSNDTNRSSTRSRIAEKSWKYWKYWNFMKIDAIFLGVCIVELVSLRNRQLSVWYFYHRLVTL